MTGTNQSDGQQFDEIPSVEEMRATNQALLDAQGESGEQNKDGGGESGDGGSKESVLKMPDKFEGKTIEQVVESYSNLETQLGQHAQEVGTLRKLNDQLLELGRPTGEDHQQVTLPDVSADDMLNDPQKTIVEVATAVSKVAVDNANTRVDELEAQLRLGQFETRHPTFRADQSDPDFQTFVAASGYRQGLAQKVHSGDLGAGDELWNAWAEDQKSRQNHEPTEQEKDEAATALALAKSGGSEGGETRLPISREKLAEIRIHDEERYYSAPFQEYVQYMYANKLVK